MPDDPFMSEVNSDSALLLRVLIFCLWPFMLPALWFPGCGFPISFYRTWISGLWTWICHTVNRVWLWWGFLHWHLDLDFWIVACLSSHYCEQKVLVCACAMVPVSFVCPCLCHSSGDHAADANAGRASCSAASFWPLLSVLLATGTFFSVIVYLPH